jgi:hypothetical protein
MVPLSSWKEYFESSERGQSFIKDMFTAKRWFSIKTCLHFENCTYRSDDPLFKIRAISDHIKNQMQQLINPAENITIDECIIPFKGRVKIRQYIPRKPHTTGIKVFMLNDANGFLWTFEIYMGRKHQNFAAYLQDKGLAVATVLTLEDRLPPGGFTFHMDNWFGNMDMLQELHARGRNVICTSKKVGIFKEMLQVPTYTYIPWNKFRILRNIPPKIHINFYDCLSVENKLFQKNGKRKI